MADSGPEAGEAAGAGPEKADAAGPASAPEDGAEDEKGAPAADSAETSGEAGDGEAEGAPAQSSSLLATAADADSWTPQQAGWAAQMQGAPPPGFQVPMPEGFIPPGASLLLLSSPRLRRRRRRPRRPRPRPRRAASDAIRALLAQRGSGCRAAGPTGTRARCRRACSKCTTRSTAG